MGKAAFVCSEGLWAHEHGDGHPMRAERLRMTFELLQAYGAFDAHGSVLVAPQPATRDELALWHTPEYVDAVARLSAGDRDVPEYRYHFSPGDNPVFHGMYDSEALKAGASLTAARMVVGGECDVAFSFAGGLHHAMAGHASGFCVFNDAAIAIRWLVSTGRRVVYVDVDAHHGDGVEAAFDDTDQVLTISLHESGHYLFPGTGFPHDRGRGAGTGYSANLPLYPYTPDETYLWAFGQVVPPLVADFAPHVLVTQLGVDTHYLDPLTHMALTTHAYESMWTAFARMGLPWVALGGGGYNVNTVARAWTLAYGVMSEQAFADPIPGGYAAQYGDRWLRDREGPLIDPQMEKRARAYAQRQVQVLRETLGAERFAHAPPAG